MAISQSNCKTYNYNLAQNICRLFHVLVQFPFTTSESELDYCPKKLNLRITSRAAERHKTQEISKFQGNS